MDVSVLTLLFKTCLLVIWLHTTRRRMGKYLSELLFNQKTLHHPFCNFWRISTKNPVYSTQNAASIQDSWPWEAIIWINLISSWSAFCFNSNGLFYEHKAVIGPDLWNFVEISLLGTTPECGVNLLALRPGWLEPKYLLLRTLTNPQLVLLKAGNCSVWNYHYHSSDSSDSSLFHFLSFFSMTVNLASKVRRCKSFNERQTRTVIRYTFLSKPDLIKHFLNGIKHNRTF